MNNFYKRWFLLKLTFAMFLQANAQSMEEPYEVALWKGFAEAAVSYTFDDNMEKQYTIAIPMFDEYGFKATFYPVTNWSPNWEVFQQAARDGHEIGSHTVNHSPLGDMDAAVQEAELRISRDTINQIMGREDCLTLAYPYCNPSVRELTDKYYIAARHCQGRIEKSTPDDFMNISSMIVGPEGGINSAAAFESTCNRTAMENGWSIFTLHGLDDDGSYSALNSGILRESLEFLDDNRDKYWVTSFVNVVKYIRERDAVSIVEMQRNNDTIIVEVTDTLDNTIYNQAVSIRRTLPNGWTAVQAVQNEKPIDVIIEEIHSNKVMCFNVVPDAGPVVISSLKIPEIKNGLQSNKTTALPEDLKRDEKLRAAVPVALQVNSE